MLSHIKGLLLTLVNSGKYEMKVIIGVTDNDWFASLSQQPGIDEVNFWQQVYAISRLKGNS